MMSASKLRVSPLDLPAYRDRIRHLPLPSLLQAHAFAEYVSKAHSWYKHLAVMQGDSGFCFYLDPDAGKNVWWDEQQGLLRVETRNPGDARLHYAEVATATAIEQFGYLEYCQLRHGSIDALQQLLSSPWISDGKQAFALPPEVLKKTFVECSALLHPYSQSLRHVFRLPNFRMLTHADFDTKSCTPEEKRLIDIVRICNEDYYQSGNLQDEYAAIAGAVREKQLSEIVKAIVGLRDILP